MKPILRLFTNHYQNQSNVILIFSDGNDAYPISRSPVHGNWNIVHTGMQVPESIQIYVCADNCMRGVVLTAAEMNAADRFSFVLVEEQNLLSGNLEDITIEGVTDVLNKRKDHPEAVLLFTVCLHHFVGSNLNYIYRELEHRFPDICFIRCYMDPIMQKHGLTPDQKSAEQFQNDVHLRILLLLQLIHQ